jgi:hypothetical protein
MTNPIDALVAATAKLSPKQKVESTSWAEL